VVALLQKTSRGNPLLFSVVALSKIKIMEFDYECLEEPNWPTIPSASAEVTKNMHKWCGKISYIVSDLLKRLKTLEDEKINVLAATSNKPTTIFTYAQATSNQKNQSKPKETEVVMMAKITNEFNNKKRIENNIIISGVADHTILDKQINEENDKQTIEIILKAIKPDFLITNAKRIIRLTKNTKRPEGPPDLILVELDNKETQNFMIKNSKNLKDNINFKNIFINKDKTANERLFDSELRKVRNTRNAALAQEVEGTNGRQRYNLHNGKKYYWGIRSGELKWIEIKS
jgi:hypothetical protein